MVEILKQDQYAPLTMAQQVKILYCGTRGFLYDIPAEAVSKFEEAFSRFITARFPDIEQIGRAHV